MVYYNLMNYGTFDRDFERFRLQLPILTDKSYDRLHGPSAFHLLLSSVPILYHRCEDSSTWSVRATDHKAQTI
jgi:hypothetical protein